MRSPEPNEQLAALLHEARWSRKAFARAVLTEADAENDLISVDHTAVGRWLNGVQPRPRTVGHITRALSRRLGRTVTPADAGLTATAAHPIELGLAYPSRTEDCLTVVENLCDADLTATPPGSAPPHASSWAEAALAWLVRPDDGPLPRASQGRRVGVADVVAIRSTTAAFSQLDGCFGGAHARRAVAQYLRSDVAPLLRGHYTETTGRQLFSAAAEATHLLAWMSYDAGVHGMAQRYFIQTLRLAQAADDVLLAASTLDAMSHQATFLGRFREAADLARAARNGTGASATPTLTAHFLMMEARALAGSGDVKGTEAAMSRAATYFERRRPEDDPEWIRYFDEAEMASELGHCYRDLRLGERAVRHATGALSTGGLPPRTDFFLTMVLAQGHADAGDLEQACLTLRMGLPLGTQMKSARCVEYVRMLRATLERHGTAATVRKLAEELNGDVLWTATARLP